MFTVVETQLFQKQWPAYWTEEERGEFASFLSSANPEAGHVVPESGGIRKVRWRRRGTGKSSGVRVIYFTRNEVKNWCFSLCTRSPRPTTSPVLYSRRSVVPSKTKPLSPKELAKFEASRDLGAELLQSIREMKAGKVRVAYSPATEARERTGLSQSQFAALLGVSVRTLQGWEQGRKQPSGAARTLLTIARTNPKALLAVAGK